MAVQVAERAYIIYRGTGRGDRPVEVHLIDVPAAGTVADAWARLSQLDPSVDPTSIEIEVRRRPRRTSRRGRAASSPINLALWVAERAAMAQHSRS